ncbi:hypothetical protein BCF33_2417 [Hasllibacter halocynthiae]|uniref:PH (Pleckstrin Homology) domain-containing protein n=1 Tax=Hasllibacter halocynthiae TaxID=595589 RepID=A0A2T0X3V5_9RHOB|nr:hypothetical protein [Hasllibacter halocynthiae]PRY93544.1 hypothetical protein BCF33_2417 [Hasllibacter halocynthiae]
MQLLSEDPQRLIAEQRPLGLAAALGGGIAMVTAAGLAEVWNSSGDPTAALTGAIVLSAAFAVALERARIDLDADRNLVRLDRVGVYGAARTVHPLAALSHAGVETTTGTEGRPDCHRLVLHFGGGEVVPASRRFLSGPATPAAVREVNRWLRRARWRMAA